VVAGFGRTEVAHPADRGVSGKVVAGALRRDGETLRAAAGAVPSLGPPDRSLLGFPGSIYRIADDVRPALQATVRAGASCRRLRILHRSPPRRWN